MKYKLTDETLNHHSTKLHRIQALRDFGDVKAGDLGGWIEKESNLSQRGDCWVYNEAKVYDDTQVLGDARIYDYVGISDYARVGGNARIYDDVFIYENADVYGNALVFGNAKVFGVRETHGDNNFAKEYLAMIKLVKIRLRK